MSKDILPALQLFKNRISVSISSLNCYDKLHILIIVTALNVIRKAGLCKRTEVYEMKRRMRRGLKDLPCYRWVHPCRETPEPPCPGVTAPEWLCTCIMRCRRKKDLHTVSVSVSKIQKFISAHFIHKIILCGVIHATDIHIRVICNAANDIMQL